MAATFICFVTAASVDFWLAYTYAHAIDDGQDAPVAGARAEFVCSQIAESFNLFNRDNGLLQITEDGLESNTAFHQNDSAAWNRLLSGSLAGAFQSFEDHQILIRRGRYSWR